MKQNKVVCLDFDGTIVDSVDECYKLSLKTLNEMGEDLEENAETKRKFENSRPYAKKGQDFYPILKLIKNREKIAERDPATIRAEVKSYNRDNLERSLRFEKKFYQLRKNYQEKNPDSWFQLHSLFPINLEKILEEFNVFIATAKDQESVKLLLNHFNFGLEENKILAREFSVDKREQLAAVKGRAGVELSEIVLVDDLLQQLESVSDLDVKLILAGWGYNTEAQRQKARKRGIKVVESPEDLYPFLQHEG